MAGRKNLVTFNDMTEERQRALASKGGLASARAAQKRRTFKDIFQTILKSEFPQGDNVGEVASKIKETFPAIETMDEAMAFAMMFRAANGDTKAFEIVRDTIGEKPQDNVKMTVDKVTIIDDV